MWRDVLEQLDELGNLLPRYTPPRCLLERQAVGGCDACLRACPHDAITLKDTELGIEINPQRCTGCGLCVQDCPTGALEYNLDGPLEALHFQRSEPQATLTCAPSGASGATLPCLGRVTPALVSAAGAWNVPLTLLHGDCSACPVGHVSVPARLEAVTRTVQELRAATHQPVRVTVRRAAPQDSRSLGVSRRDAFATLLRAGRKQVARQLPERPLPFVDWTAPAHEEAAQGQTAQRQSAEWTWRARTLKPAPAADAVIQWPAPLVAEGCIDCPVCANVCPTEAIVRDLQPEGGVHLLLNLSACTGCMACQRSCPPQVITRQTEWFYAALSQQVLLRESDSVM